MHSNKNILNKYVTTKHIMPQFTIFIYLIISIELNFIFIYVLIIYLYIYFQSNLNGTQFSDQTSYEGSLSSLHVQEETRQNLF